MVHCSATQPKTNIGAKEIDRWHREAGYLKIGYHYVIRRDGTVEAGRKFPDEVGAHAYGVNQISCGICMVGGVDEMLRPENNFTADQFHSLALLLGELSSQYPDAEILGHRDLPKVTKACPSFKVRQWWKDTGLNTSESSPLSRLEIASLFKSRD